MKYKPHAVYLMKNMWSDANYKIGFSNNPSRRGVEVEDQYGVEPKIICTCWFPTEFDARAAERIWHRRYENNRSEDHSGKEWFALTRTQVSEFEQWCLNSPDHRTLLDDLFKGHKTERQIK